MDFRVGKIPNCTTASCAGRYQKLLITSLKSSVAVTTSSISRSITCVTLWPKSKAFGGRGTLGLNLAPDSNMGSCGHAVVVLNYFLELARS